MMKIRTMMLAAMLAATVVPGASAQTTDSNEVMFHWGTVHRGADQAILLNFELTDHFGEPLTLPVELQVEDKNGSVVYRNTLMVSDGHAVSFAVGPEIRTLRTAVAADIYAVVAPEIRTIQPCIKVNWPPGPTSPVDRMTLTLEVMDAVTGKVVSVVNNPHSIIGVLKQ